MAALIVEWIPRRLIMTNDSTMKIVYIIVEFHGSIASIKSNKRISVLLILVGNRLLHITPWPFISVIQVSDGFDVADSELGKRLEADDLVIMVEKI